MKRNSFYYCSKACQRDHWKIHKTVCMKTRDPEAANITAAALNGVGIFASGLANPGVAADQDNRAGHNPAAKNPGKFTHGQLQSIFLLPFDFGQAARF